MNKMKDYFRNDKVKHYCNDDLFLNLGMTLTYYYDSRSQYIHPRAMANNTSHHLLDHIVDFICRIKMETGLTSYSFEKYASDNLNV